MHHRKKVDKEARELQQNFKDDNNEAILKDTQKLADAEKAYIDRLREKNPKTKKAQEANKATIKEYDDKMNMMKSLPAYKRASRRRIAKENGILKWLVPKFTKQQADAITKADPIELTPEQKAKFIKRMHV